MSYSKVQIQKLNDVKRSALQLSVLCFLLMTLGSIVRATDSGLSCPDWPMCFGQVIPQMDIQIFLEWFHRLVALCLGILLCKLSFTVLRGPSLRKTFSMEVSVAITLFLLQCILGGLTVLKLLEPSIVSSHLLTALLFLGLLLWVWRRSFHLSTNKQTSTEANPWSFFLCSILVYLQLGLGGMVSSNNAGLVCPDFPTCHGSWTGMGQFLASLQMYHRYFAFFLFLSSIILFLKYRKVPLKSVYFGVRLFPILLSFQILLGVLNIFLAMPLWARALHHANAILLFVVLLIPWMDLSLAKVSIKSLKGSSL